MSSYRFRVLGPFDVPVAGEGDKRHIDCRPARRAVFSAADASVDGAFEIKDAIGLYVFGLSTGRSRQWPYYVGKACKQSLWVRSFQLSDKPRVYSEILLEYQSAKPFMYLLPLLTPKRNVAKLGSNAKRIKTAEEQLIGMALQANFDLWNVKHRASLESFSIDGVHTMPGKRSKAADEFRSLLGFEPRIRVSASDQ